MPAGSRPHPADWTGGRAEQHDDENAGDTEHGLAHRELRGLTEPVGGPGRLPYPQVLAYLTIAAELGLGLLIALGFYARAASVFWAPETQNSTTTRMRATLNTAWLIGNSGV
jgi:hypothetical protein